MSDVMEFALQSGRKAAKILAEGFGSKGLSLLHKSQRELVTEFDRRSEEVLLRDLSQTPWPVQAEETCPGTSTPGETYWAVDPLDGTNNFAFGIPHFALSIALIREGAPVLGVIIDPLRKEEFCVEMGNGSFLNGKPIWVSSRKEIGSGIVATGFPYDRSPDNYNNTGNFSRVTLNVRGIRRMGAASLDLAYVSCGRFDAYWETNLKIWDMAAGVLLVKESGGMATRLSGAPWFPGHDDILASNPPFHHPLRKLLDLYDPI
ncbi:MAG TPA: inositol monophosphatase [Firmicutes bacterium]|nr:inositol monophosphatase [Bacillota bacterium]